MQLLYHYNSAAVLSRHAYNEKNVPKNELYHHYNILRGHLCMSSMHSRHIPNDTDFLRMFSKMKFPEILLKTNTCYILWSGVLKLYQMFPTMFMFPREICLLKVDERE